MAPHRVQTNLASFLYQLMRDHVPPGVVQRVLEESRAVPVDCSNGYLAKYAEEVAQQLSELPEELVY
jgi:hypothetical protein